MSSNALTYLKLRETFQQPAFESFFEDSTGMSLGASDDFGVHSMRVGDYLRPHADDNNDRALALVMYLTPGWDPTFGDPSTWSTGTAARHASTPTTTASCSSTCSRARAIPSRRSNPPQGTPPGSPSGAGITVPTERSLALPEPAGSAGDAWRLILLSFLLLFTELALDPLDRGEHPVPELLLELRPARELPRDRPGVPLVAARTIAVPSGTGRLGPPAPVRRSVPGRDRSGRQRSDLLRVVRSFGSTRMGRSSSSPSP